MSANDTHFLEVVDASVQFGELRAVDGASLICERGIVHALIGPNGAGKSTLFNAITGNVALSGGDILFNGKSIVGLGPSRVASLGIRRTFQHGGLLQGMTVFENLLVGTHQEIHYSVFSAMFRPSVVGDIERKCYERAEEMASSLGIAGLLHRPVSQLSGGERRMVEIARALIAESNLLLLDEPAVGLIPPARLEIMKFITNLAKSRNVGVILIEHSIDMVLSGADLITVLNFGRTIATGTPSEICNNKEVIDAYLGYC